MAGYKEHISVSGLCGAGYGAAATFLFGFTPVQGLLAGIFTWVAGMLPDLDSQTGKPVREIFGLLAAITPFVMMGHLLKWGGDPEGAILLAILVYAAIRYGAAVVLGKVSVHRGMFHSIPALVIAAELAFLAYKSEQVSVKSLMALGVAIGFLSHLLLDELYSVQWTGIRIRLKNSSGSAMKFVGKEFLPNVVTYAILLLLTYASLLDVGLLKQPGLDNSPELLRSAAEELPDGRQ